MLLKTATKRGSRNRRWHWRKAFVISMVDGSPQRSKQTSSIDSMVDLQLSPIVKLMHGMHTLKG